MGVRALFLARSREGRAGGLTARHSAAEMSGFVGAELLLAAIPLDIALLETWWTAPDTFRTFTAWITADACAYTLLLCPLVAALLADRVFAAHTPFEARLRTWARLARAVITAVPILGAYALPLWSRSAARVGPAPWLCDPRRPAPGLGLRPRADSRRGARRSPWPRGTLALVTALALSGLVVFVWTLRFTSRGWPASPAGRLLASLAVHAAIALAMAHTGWPRHPWRASRTRLALSSLGFMLPMPLTLVALAAGTPHSLDPERTLVRYVFHRSRLAVAAAGFRGAERDTREAWRRARWWKRVTAPRGLDPLRPLGLAAARRLALWRLGTWLLVFESAWIAAWTARAWPASAPTLEWLAVGALVAAGAGAVPWSASLAARFLRLTERVDAAERRPWARYATLAPLACACGLLFGRAAALGPIRLVYAVLLWGVVLALATWLSLLVPYTIGSQRRTDTHDMAWPVAQFLTCPALAVLARAWLDGADPLDDLPALALASAALHACVGARLGGWLTRPLAWRHLADPRQPGRLRLLLVLLGTAVPCSGLLTPAWIAWSGRWSSPRPEKPCLGRSG